MGGLGERETRLGVHAGDLLKGEESRLVRESALGEGLQKEAGAGIARRKPLAEVLAWLPTNPYPPPAE